MFSDIFQTFTKAKYSTFEMKINAKKTQLERTSDFENVGFFMEHFLFNDCHVQEHNFQEAAMGKNPPHQIS